MKKQAKQPFVRRHIDIKTYEYRKTPEHRPIGVTMKIDFDEQAISIVESMHPLKAEFETKHFVFSSRGLEYMEGWHNILDAMHNAITLATKELDEYTEAKKEEFVDEVVKFQFNKPQRN